MGPLHGFGIARRIEQLSEDVLQLNEVREIRADGK
jgi:PadR family transcriptional regulator PadR